MLADKKKVSVVMCTFNGEKYLKEQIESIINQTYPVYEIIIQDDNSTDHTMEILRDYERKFANIHVFRNETQEGINKNFFSAIDRATGDYIALSDQDDVWHPEKIEMQIPYSDDYLLIASSSKPFASGNNVKIYFDERKIKIHLEREIYVNMIAGHTMLFKKSFVEKIPDLELWCDYFLYDHVIAIVAAAYNSITFLPQVLVHQRRHINSASYTEPINYEKTLPNVFLFIGRTFIQYFRLRPKMRTHFKHLYRLLEAIDISSEEKKNAMALAGYHSRSTFASYCGLTVLCVKLRKILFYAEEKNTVLSILRALYFPISCSDYFRYMSKPRKNY